MSIDNDSIEKSPHALRSTVSLPSHAQVVVIGAGIIGCSVAYHLAREGCRDVVLLEREQAGSGTTWHSLGFVGLLRTSPTLTRLALRTRKLIPELERETGRSAGFSARGSINVTAKKERMQSFLRIADVGRSLGLEVHQISPKEAADLMPIGNFDDIIGGINIPLEGQCSPMDLLQTYLAAARLRGVKFFEQCKVINMVPGAKGGFDVTLENGNIHCETIVNCSGLWARDFGIGNGVRLPVQAVRHNYLVTEAIERIPPDLPLMRDMDTTIAVREDAAQLSVGFSEPFAQLFAEEKVPDRFCFDQLPPDWDIAMPYLEDALRRVPVLRETGIRMYMCGPEGVSPDSRYILGPMQGCPNYFVASGFSGVGIGSSGGAGQAIAEWVLSGSPQEDLWDVDVRRFVPAQYSREYMLDRAAEASGRIYALNWPHYQFQSGRNLYCSPIHDSLSKVGARFGIQAGWEVPDWFEAGAQPSACETGVDRHYTFFRPKWLAHSRREASHALAGLAISDRSAIAKYQLEGSGALPLLSRLVATNPNIKIGTSCLAPVLDGNGNVRTLWWLIRQGATSFLLLSEPEARIWDLDYLQKATCEYDEVILSDRTEDYYAIELIGEKCLDLANHEEFRNIMFCKDPRPDFCVTLLVAEAKLAQGHYDALRMLVPDLGHLGRHARHALWTHSSVPLWPQGIFRGVSMEAARLERFCRPADEQDFIGRVGLSRRIEGSPEQQLLLVQPKNTDSVFLGQEEVLHGQEVIGKIIQPAYPIVSDRALGLACISYERFPTDVTVRIAGELIPAQIYSANSATDQLFTKEYQARMN